MVPLIVGSFLLALETKWKKTWTRKLTLDREFETIRKCLVQQNLLVFHFSSCWIQYHPSLVPLPQLFNKPKRFCQLANQEVSKTFNKWLKLNNIEWQIQCPSSRQRTHILTTSPTNDLTLFASPSLFHKFWERIWLQLEIIISNRNSDFNFK